MLANMIMYLQIVIYTTDFRAAHRSEPGPTSEVVPTSPTAPPPAPPSINYGSMLGMVVGVAVLFAVCTYGKYVFRAVKFKLENSARFPFPPVVLSQAYYVSFLSPSPKPLDSQSASIECSISTDTTAALTPSTAATTPATTAPTSGAPTPSTTAPIGTSRTPPRHPVPGPTVDPLGTAICSDTLVKCTTV